MLKFMLLAVVVLLSGCGGGKCINPGLEIESDQEVRVPVMPAGADSKRPATYWVNSGYSVKEGEKLKITVEGNIDFCPIDSSSPPVTVQMYPDSLSEKEEDYYDTHITVVPGDQLTFSAFQYDVHFPTCEKIVRERSPVIYYGEGTIFVDDKCTNSIDVSKICSAGGKGVRLDDALGKGSKEFALYLKDGKGKCEKVEEVGFPKVGGSTIKTPRLQFPIGYIASISGGEVKEKGFVVNGYLHDARTVRMSAEKIDDSACQAVKKYGTNMENLVNVKQIISPNGQGKFTSKLMNCSNGKCTDAETSVANSSSAAVERDKMIKLLKEYTEYDINCNCERICSPSSSNRDCIKTIVNVSSDGEIICPTSRKIAESVSTSSDEKDAFNSFADSTKAEDIQKAALAIKLDALGIDTKIFEVPTGQQSVQSLKAPYMLAEGVVAVIDSSNGQGNRRQDLCKTGKCFYASNTGKFEVFGSGNQSSGTMNLKLDMPITVEEGQKGKVFLAYEHKIKVDSAQRKAADQRGFYALNVHRTCYASGGRKLYVHVGDSPPVVLPGSSNGDTELNMDKLKAEGFSYMINGSASSQKGNVYFAVKVDAEYEDQLRKAGNIENYYTVHVWTSKKPPLFSTFFGYLQGILLHVLYGSVAPGEIGNQSSVGEISSVISQALDKTPGTSGHASQKIGAVQQIYKNQVVSVPFWTAVRALLTLYLMFSVLGYIMGVIQVTKYDLAVRIAKIAFILLLVSKGSWEFFNEHCFKIFTVGLSEVISAFNGYLGGDTSFAFLDSTLGLFLTSGFWVRMLALFGAGPVGWLMFIGLIWALWSFFLAMIRGIIMYLFVVVALAFLVTLAPLFITFMLFQITRGMFDAWIKMIVNFSLQPIILFASLAFLNQIIQVTVHGVTNYTACESCVLGFDITSSDPKSPGKKDICVLPAMLPMGFSSDISISDRVREELSRTDIGFMGLPFSVAMLFILILACKATREFGQIAEVMAHSISGSVAGVTASFTGATQAMLGVVGMDAATQHLISSARGMTPVGTDKLHFQNEESLQPRHEGTDHVPDEKQDMHAGKGAGNKDDSGVDIASGGSGSRAPDEGRDVVSGGSGESQQREGESDDRYVSMPVPGTSAFQHISGDAPGGRMFSDIDDTETNASTAPDGHIYEEIGGGATSLGSTESLHIYEEIDDLHGGGDVVVDENVTQGQGTEEISGNTQEGGNPVVGDVGDSSHGGNLDSDFYSGAGVAVGPDSVRDTESVHASELRFDDMLDNVESSSLSSFADDSGVDVKDVSGSGDSGTVDGQSKMSSTPENYTQSFVNTDGESWGTGERGDTSEKNFSDGAEGVDSNSQKARDKRGFGVVSEVQEKDSSLDEKLSKNPDNNPTKKDTQD